MKRFVCISLLFSIFLCMVGCSSGVAQEDFDALMSEKNELQKEYDALNSGYDNLNLTYNDLDSQLAELQAKYDELLAEKDKLNKSYDALELEYNNYKEETADFVKMTEDEKAAALARAEAERIAAEEAKRQAEEAAAKAEAERKAREEEEARRAEEERRAEEAKGYETGITFKELSRSPEKHVGSKVKFTGYVLQVMESDELNTARMSTSGKYDDVIYIAYDPDLIDVRLLEDDKITIYGIFIDMYTYETVLGSTVTLPLISLDRLDIHE